MVYFIQKYKKGSPFKRSWKQLSTFYALCNPFDKLEFNEFDKIQIDKIQIDKIQIDEKKKLIKKY